MTTIEAAKYLRVNKSTITREIAKGHLKATKVWHQQGNGQYRYEGSRGRRVTAGRKLEPIGASLRLIIRGGRQRVKDYQLTLIVPVRDISNTIAYAAESLMRVVGSDDIACGIEIKLRVRMSEAQAEDLVADAAAALKRLRNEYGVTVLQVLGLHEVVSEDTMVRMGSARMMA